MPVLPRLIKVTVVATLLALTATVTGCGSDASDSAKGGTGTEAQKEAQSVENGAYPVTIDHEYGSTTITKKPERVVTVGLVEQDATIALGTVPVAVTDWFGTAPGRIFPWAKPLIGTSPIPQVLPGTLDVEKIAALHPDLIVALYSDISKKQYQLLSAIAPTIAHPAGQNDYSISWQDVTTTVGKALGRPAAAQKLVDGVEAKFAAARKEHPKFEGKEALMGSLYEGIFVYAPSDPRGQILHELGFSFPADVKFVGKDTYGESISPENADLVDVDAMVWIDSEKKVRKAVPTYGNLRLSREGRSVFVPEDFGDPVYVSTSFVTVLSLPYMLEHLVPRLAAAVDGDPATATS